MAHRCEAPREHWRFCPWCGQEVTYVPPEHPPGTCRICGKKASSPSTTFCTFHYWFRFPKAARKSRDHKARRDQLRHGILG